MNEIPEVNMKKSTTKGNDECLQAYFDQIRSIALLTFEEEQELSRCIKKGDEAARRRLIEANLRLVVKIARTYNAPDIPLMDLIQEGNVGLMRAADKYDHLKQVRFSTYAAWWIRQGISRFLSNKRRTIRLPHRKEEVLRRIQRAHYTLSQLHMRAPKAEEIAEEINVPRGDVDYLLNMASEFFLFNSDRNEKDPLPVVEFHEDYTYSPERMLMKKSSREVALQVLDVLKDREKRILIYRYQLNGEKEHTLKTIGDKMGLSTETVRQIELKALRKLRTHADELRIYMEAM